MSDISQIPAPPPGFAREVRYAIRPREKRAFHSVLDAERLLAGGGQSTVRYAEQGDDILLATDHPIVAGRIREQVVYARGPGGLVARSLTRELTDGGGRALRREEVADYHPAGMGLPHATYPEVTLPFVLGWLPLDGQRRSLYAWINDRFVAKVYVETAGRAGDRVEVVMYPDLNDWVRLGSVLRRLAKPFIPKYHMWFETAPPHGLVRFEGPYGPPGAPEIVLERI
jgi:hypothetical protein